MYVKRINVRFYISLTGSEPVKDWLMTLPREDRKKIGSDIKDAEFGWPIGMPVCRSLKSGLYEIRSSLSTSRIARVFFCIEEGEMFLLHGFIKKTQKTPEKELEIARRRQRRIKNG